MFEITGSGFVVSRKFDSTPGSPNCIGQSVSPLARQYGGFIGAADALDYPSVRELQDAIVEFCEPEEVAKIKYTTMSKPLAIWKGTWGGNRCMGTPQT